MKTILVLLGAKLPQLACISLNGHVTPERSTNFFVLLYVGHRLGFVYIGVKATAISLPDWFKESKLMFILSSNKAQRKNFAFAQCE